MRCTSWGRARSSGCTAQMDGILKGIGYSQGTVGERMRALAKDPRYQFPQGDKGRAEILAFINDRLAWIRAQLPRAFKTLVNPNMEVRRLPPEEEPGAPAAYGGAGSIDGKIPGRFWINLRTTDLHSRYSLADLTFHEAIPGHIWQGEYTHRMPLIRQLLSFNAYSEGWALYAEQLADELGAYDDFPVGRLGYLQAIAFRACRLVVDTGIHAKRWTRDQGVKFFVDVNGSNPVEVASEVDRYCSWPGQACGYKVGHSEITRQRDRAKSALAAKFDLKAFDDAVVLGGNVPLDVLAKNVDAYILSPPVLLVGDLLQPVHGLAVELLVNGDVRHPVRCGGPVPMLLARRNPHHVARPDLLPRPAPALGPAAAGDHDQGLAQRVGVPGGPGSRLEGDRGAGCARRSGGLEQRIDPHRAGEPVGRSSAGRAGTTSGDVHHYFSLRPDTW